MYLTLLESSRNVYLLVSLLDLLSKPSQVRCCAYFWCFTMNVSDSLELKGGEEQWNEVLSFWRGPVIFRGPQPGAHSCQGGKAIASRLVSALASKTEKQEFVLKICTFLLVVHIFICFSLDVYLQSLSLMSIMIFIISYGKYLLSIFNSFSRNWKNWNKFPRHN